MVSVREYTAPVLGLGVRQITPDERKVRFSEGPWSFFRLLNESVNVQHVDPLNVFLKITSVSLLQIPQIGVTRKMRTLTSQFPRPFF